ncbi:MAG: hypothetical protein JW925_13140 [Syntrophaceae bacterium]|nr:hypothetical protein [Syntrophaceae bacterium]
MVMRLLVLFFFGCVCIACHGCTYRAWYEGFKETERQECYKIVNQTERQQCLDRVDSITYDEYKKAKEDLKK